MSDAVPSDELLCLATEIVAAYVSNNSVPAGGLPELIRAVYAALSTVGSRAAQLRRDLPIADWPLPSGPEG